MAILIAIIAFTIYQKVMNRVPKFFGYSVLTVITPSMDPTIPVDACIIVQEIAPRELEVGDIITFYSKDVKILNRPNTHRIVAIEEEDGELIFTTKGDANNAADTSKVHEGDLIGKYKTRTKFFEVLLGIAKKKNVVFTVIISLAAVLVILQVVRIVLIKKSEKEELLEEAENKSEKTKAIKNEEKPVEEEKVKKIFREKEEIVYNSETGEYVTKSEAEEKLTVIKE